jgi:hypothetical protein
LVDEEPIVRGHAAWALGRIRGDRIAEVLAFTAEREMNERVLEEIRRSL